MSLIHGCGRSAISTSRRRGSTAAGTSTTGCRRISRPTGWPPGWPGWRRPASPAAAREDPHDEAHLRAFEELQRVVYADLELHRSNPMLHLGELDLACYDKDYAPEAERLRRPGRAPGRLAGRHRRGGRLARRDSRPDRGLAARRRPRAGGRHPGRRRPGARGRRRWPRTPGWSPTCSGRPIPGRPTPRSGPAALAALLSSAEAIDVDLAALAARADAERDRLMERLAESAAAIDEQPRRPLTWPASWSRTTPTGRA